MPIKFRCPVCEGLLSIARRKAGTRVVCPKCRDEVTVPDADLAGGDFEAADEADMVGRVEARGGAEIKDDPPLFRPGELDKLLGSDDSLPSAPIMKPGGPSALTEPDIPPTEDGILLTRGTLVLMAVLIVVLIALAFATGYLIGS